jgi:hypothetical protein
MDAGSCDEIGSKSDERELRPSVSTDFSNAFNFFGQ